MEPASIHGELQLRDVYSGRTIALARPDVTVSAGPRVATDAGATAPVKLGQTIGEAVSPRKLLSAIHDGHLLGKSL